MTMPRYCAAVALVLASAAQAMPPATDAARRGTVPRGNSYCFDAAAQRYHVNREVLIAIAWKESHFLPWYRHTNSDGSVDYGLMQINSRNLASLHLDAHSVMAPCTNIMAGAELYSRQVRRFGNTWRAVGSYHSTTPTLRDAYSKDISRRYAWIQTLRGWFARARSAVEHALGLERDRGNGSR
jgi:soluble lytic murein transglycosylase-like protein